MASNMRAELEKSRTSSSSSALENTAKSSAPFAHEDNHSSVNDRITTTLMQGTEQSSCLTPSTDPAGSASSTMAEASHSTDIDKSRQSARESAYPQTQYSSENASSMASDTRIDQNQATASKYTRLQQLSPIPESGLAAPGYASALLPSASEISGHSGLQENAAYVVRMGRKRNERESMIRARNQRIARFRADYSARKGSHRFTSMHYSSNRSPNVSGSNTSDASDNCENEVHLYNWKLKRIQVGQSLAIVLGGIHCTLDKPWHSTRIVSRIDNHKLVSSSGKIYRLNGELDVEGMLLNEFPLELCHQFQDGFPPNWDKLILPHILPETPIGAASFTMNSDSSLPGNAILSSAQSSANLSTGTDSDLAPLPGIATLLASVQQPKIDSSNNEHTSPMSWKSQSSVSASPIPNLNATATENVQNDACGSDSCQGDYSNVSDTTYQTDGSKNELKKNSISAGVQTVLPQQRHSDESCPLSQFSIHHIHADSVSYPHTPCEITNKTLKRRQEQDQPDEYFQLPARKRVVSEEMDTGMNDGMSNDVLP